MASLRLCGEYKSRSQMWITEKVRHLPPQIPETSPLLSSSFRVWLFPSHSQVGGHKGAECVICVHASFFFFFFKKHDGPMLEICSISSRYGLLFLLSFFKYLVLVFPAGRNKSAASESFLIIFISGSYGEGCLWVGNKNRGCPLSTL